MTSTFGVIGWFVSTAFAESAKNFLVKCADGTGGTVTKWECQAHYIPLFLCESREDIKIKGVRCPYEFIIERADLLPELKYDTGELCAQSERELRARLKVLLELHANYAEANGFESAMRDWLAGAFRLYLMLDSKTHGSSKYIDLDAAKRKTDSILNALAERRADELDENVLILKGRFGTGGIDHRDSLKGFTKFAKKLYPEYFEAWEKDEEHTCQNVKRSITKVITSKESLSADDLKEALARIYEDGERRWDADAQKEVLLRHDERLPVAYGDRAKYITPNGKLNLLLVDDHVEKSPLGNLIAKNPPEDIHKDDWELLKAVFDVQLLPIDGDKNPLKVVREEFPKRLDAGMSYDVILIDLCLGAESQESDLEGYATIRLAKLFFPGTPIVVYSRFRDMGHIARAFFSGARWFLVKGEEAKLPRHVLSLIKHVGWHREWRTVEQGPERPDFRFEKADDFKRHFEQTPEWKYLTYKCLEYLPGNRITLRRMGGGISSAATFKAVKGGRSGEEYLQTPNIIKIDTAYNTLMEFERYFRMIRPYMANEAGRVEKPELAINRQYAAIVYTFAGKQDPAHELKAMSEMVGTDILYKSTCDYEKYRYALDCVFDEILPKIHRVTSDERAAYTSFPNAYLNEFPESEFWKSYALRLQPWGRYSVDDPNWFKRKQPESPTSCPRLMFHNVMIDPEKTDRYLIEAYTQDKKLIWLDGEASDFVARFRKHIRPGTSIWLEKEIEVEDRRLAWLKGVTSAWKKGGPCLEKDFFRWSAALADADCVEFSKEVYVCLQDDVLAVAKKVAGDMQKYACASPVGIVHGDMNLANVMLESRICAATAEDPDTTRKVSDVWFIDFARTRRDLIAHDFNVYFTSVLGELFRSELLEDETYCETLKVNFRCLVEGAVASKTTTLAGVPDALRDDERLTFVYKMLHRGHMAALKAGVSQNMYLLTTALASLYTLKIFLNNRPKDGNPLHSVIKAAGYFATAQICFGLLPKRMRDLVEAEKLKGAQK